MSSKSISIAGKPSLNSFFEEISKCSRYNYNYIDFLNSICSDAVLIIHWPESLIDWKKPNRLLIERVEKQLIEYKPIGNIIYVVNNFQSHAQNSSWSKKLYRLVEEQADAHVHLGTYSLKKFELKYPSINQVLIDHPLYLKAYTVSDRLVARHEMKLPIEATVFIAPGRIRNKKEASMVINAFEKLKIDPKILLIPFMRDPFREFDFKGRTRLKKLLDIKKLLRKLYRKSGASQNIWLNYNSMSARELGKRLSAADVVIIPRVTTLNSGVFYLAMTFKKIVVGPNVGNLGELLTEFGLPKFNPYDINEISSAIDDAFNLVGNESRIYNSNRIGRFQPSRVASKWDALIESFMDLEYNE